MKQDDVTLTVKVRVDGVLHDWESFTPEEKKDISARISKKFMEAAGFVAIPKKSAATE